MTWLLTIRYLDVYGPMVNITGRTILYLTYIFRAFKKVSKSLFPFDIFVLHHLKRGTN